MDGFDIEEQRGPHHYAGTGESEINKKKSSQMWRPSQMQCSNLITSYAHLFTAKDRAYRFLISVPYVQQVYSIHFVRA